jgi:hypothetical protein
LRDTRRRLEEEEEEFPRRRREEVKEQLGLDEEERLCMVTVIVGAMNWHILYWNWHILYWSYELAYTEFLESIELTVLEFVLCTTPLFS